MTNPLGRVSLRLALMAAVCISLAACVPLRVAEPNLAPRGTESPPVFQTAVYPTAPPRAPSLTPGSTATATRTATTTLTATASPTTTPTPSPTPVPLRIAVIGDYGSGSPDEAAVADLVKSWKPDLILTVGDNNYPVGEARTLDRAVGQFFHDYIAPYRGSYGAGAEVNRFFPTLGNHDWMAPNAKPYLDYFSLPGNERYYDFVQGPVHFFALDSDPNEPDGVGQSSVQATWLQERLAEAKEPWKVVYFHHAPFSSGLHGGTGWMDWPFKQWGADLVLSGHDHTYERLEEAGLTYTVNGLGGGAIYAFRSKAPGSQVRFNSDYGAQLIEATPDSLILQFITVKGQMVDSCTLTH